MLALSVLIGIGAIAWQLAATGSTFLAGFAPLLEQATLTRGLGSVFSGRSYLTGRFEGREVAVRLQLKRSRYGQGYLVVAMRVRGAAGVTSRELEARVNDDHGRRALVAIASADLILELDEGWLKALWRPQGFVIFPGRFVADDWRSILRSMDVVARSLDATAS